MKERRHEKILDILFQYKYASINFLAEQLSISTNTIRNDIKYLVQQEKIAKTHGGAVYINNFIKETEVPLYRYDEFEYRRNINVEKKEKIAKLVVDKLPKTHNISIFMDGSTTCIQIAEALKNYPYRLIIVTNFPIIIDILCDNPNITIFLLGGMFWKEEKYTVGRIVCDMILNHHTDISIVGVAAVSLDLPTQGAYDPNLESITIKKNMMCNAKQHWLVCDSTKFDKTGLFLLCDIKNFHTIFTDTKPHNYDKIRSYYGDIFIYSE